jgi:uncharacterized lipoprotein YddW (UPF0748 family)
MRLFSLIACAALLASTTAPAHAQSTSPKHEFRASWIATVVNLDWPDCQTCSSNTQKAQLITMLDKHQEAGINAILFQVRSESDAMYPSAIEPWSYWLTGTQGVGPQPAFDPLQFAIEEAHKRGMELHAWLNPYRADRGSSYPKAANHVTVQHPDWILTVGSISVVDPGLQEVRDRIAAVVGDIARRYAIDGIHFDDYFYPYPPNQIANQDAATFAAHPRGFTNLGDWRRDNVNLMVAQVQDTLLAIRPEAKFGISPFGIWRSGTPSGTSGLDAYSVIYGDAVAWLNAQTIDYVTPQLYWSSERVFPAGTFNQQRYTTLAAWWASVRNERHLYPGHGLYRADAATFTGTLFPAHDVPFQVRFNRASPDIQGSVFFRAKNISQYSSRGFADSLRADLYRYPALAPPMDWKDQTAPETPTTLSTSVSGDEVTLSWGAPASGLAPRFYAVYRVQADTPPAFPTAPTSSADLLAVTGETSITDRPVASPTPYHYVVTAVSANSIESVPSNVVSVTGTAVSTEAAPAGGFALLPNRPNPFAEQTEIAFSLAAPATVTLRVVDALGREVARLLDQAALPDGLHARTWTPGASVGSGTYFVVLDTGDARATQPMLIVR